MLMGLGNICRGDGGIGSRSWKKFPELSLVLPEKIWLTQVRCEFDRIEEGDYNNSDG